jgi:hypothetical protein
MSFDLNPGDWASHWRVSWRLQLDIAKQKQLETFMRVKLMKTWLVATVLTIAIAVSLAEARELSASEPAASQPNVLWILTDDHRYDSIRAFNQILHGREMSELGYVESPNTDRLAKMGTTFINTYCQA